MPFAPLQRSAPKIDRSKLRARAGGRPQAAAARSARAEAATIGSSPQAQSTDGGIQPAGNCTAVDLAEWASDPILNKIRLHPASGVVIGPGARGASVELLQRFLLTWGCDTGRVVLPHFGADAIFGTETAVAVREFQGATEIKVDSLVGPETLSQMDFHLFRRAGGQAAPPDDDFFCFLRPSESETTSGAAENGGVKLAGAANPGAGPGAAVLAGLTLLCQLRGGGSGAKVPGPCGKTSAGNVFKKFGGTFQVCEFIRVALEEGRVIDLPNIVFAEGGRWKFKATVAAKVPATLPFDKLEAGFVQTVDDLEFAADYTLDWEERRKVAGPARDVSDNTTPAPWYSPEAFTDLAANKVMDLDDKPLASFPQRQPRNVRPPGLVGGIVDPRVTRCAELEGVSAKGEFHFWLVVRRTDEPLSVSNLLFLKNATVSFAFTKQASRSSTTGALLLGNEAFDKPAIKIGEGQGSGTPVLSQTPTANQMLKIALTLPGASCPLKLPAPEQKDS